MNFTVFGTHMRVFFQVHPINLSVAVWVGFLALFGIASDNGVIMATYLDQTFDSSKPKSVQAVREATPEKYMKKIEDDNVLLESVQEECPVMGGKIDKKVYADYKGRRIYFCCPACTKNFEKNPEKYLKKLE